MAKEIGYMQWEPEPEIAQKIVDLYQAGETTVTIPKLLNLGISQRTLHRWFDRNEIKRRKPLTKDSNCIACGKRNVGWASRAQLCFTCAPDKSWRARYYNFGLTKPQFEKLLEKQSGLCDLCELPLPSNVIDIKIDHCHKQGHVRALLHNKCNIGLHYIEDDKFLANAIRYIERHKR